MVNTNKDSLVMVAIQGEISPIRIPFPYYVSHNGKPLSTTIGMGSICYNVKVGDKAFGWSADHIEPGVTVVFSPKEVKREEWLGLHIPACIGNEAIVVSGETKGARGIVTGLHSGVLIDFAQEELDKFAIGDKILIKAYGLGLSLTNFTEIRCANAAPFLLEKICYEDNEILGVKVVKEIPPELMGSGLGMYAPFYIDYDVMTSDEDTIKELGLDNLKLGDVIAISHHFSSFGPSYKKGALTIGVVIHGDSKIAGHGPGILPILTTLERRKIKLELVPDSNIGYYLGCGKYRR